MSSRGLVSGPGSASGPPAVGAKPDASATRVLCADGSHSGQHPAPLLPGPLLPGPETHKDRFPASWFGLSPPVPSSLARGLCGPTHTVQSPSDVQPPARPPAHPQVSSHPTHGPSQDGSIPWLGAGPSPTGPCSGFAGRRPSRKWDPRRVLLVGCLLGWGGVSPAPIWRRLSVLSCVLLPNRMNPVRLWHNPISPVSVTLSPSTLCFCAATFRSLPGGQPLGRPSSRERTVTAPVVTRREPGLCDTAGWWGDNAGAGGPRVRLWPRGLGRACIRSLGKLAFLEAASGMVLGLAWKRSRAVSGEAQRP